MQTFKFSIGRVPAVLYGEAADRVFLFIHGKCGCKEEAAGLAEQAVPCGWQVLGVDLPGHGARADEADRFVPWEVVPELRTVLAYARERWRQVALRATSIGAWFSMLAFADEPLTRCLFVSPVLDMNRLIGNMMAGAGVTEDELEARQTIETDFGETLSWKYYQYAQAHPVTRWSWPTAILYAGRDEMTSRAQVEDFAGRFGCALTVMEDGEHWFHTPEQLDVLRQWTARQLRPVTEVVAALIWDGDRFLACQRPAHKARGLLWEFVGGKVESGETREEALVRECREELGVTVAVHRVFMDVTHIYPDLTVHLTLFNASIAQGEPKKLEHNDIRWITVDEIDRYPFCPADEAILERLRAQGAPDPDQMR